VPNGFLPYRLEDGLLEPPLRVGLNPPKVDFLSPKEDLLPPPLAVLRPLREEGLKVFIAIMVKGVSLNCFGEGLKAVYREKLLARPLAWLERWEQILGMRNGEFEVYTAVHKNSSTANDNEDAPDIESCKRSTLFLER
jgi:hypothetical protein